MYGSSFWVTMETVRSLIEAHAKKEIKKLTVSYQKGHGEIPLAELLPEEVAADPGHFISPIAVGRYLGWMEGGSGSVT